MHRLIRISSLVTVLFAVALALAVVPDAPDAAAQRPPIELTLTLDRVAFEPGAYVGFTLRARNVTPYTIPLTFVTDQRFDVVVRSDVAEVSRWSLGRTYPVAPTQLVLGAFQTLTYADGWIPTSKLTPRDALALGDPIQPGVYTATGELSIADQRIQTNAQPFVVGRPTPLPADCTTLPVGYPATLPVALIAATVEPPEALGGLWHYDSRTLSYRGFVLSPNAPVNLPSVARGDVLIICLAAPGRILLPA